MERVRIAADESGATGENLLDRRHRYLTIGTVRCTEREAETWIAELRAAARPQAAELKYEHFDGARKRHLDTLLSRLLAENRIGVYAVDKLYMLVAKMVDIVVEEHAHSLGRDIYATGEARAIADVLFRLAPGALGREVFEDLQRQFLALARRKEGGGAGAVEQLHSVIDAALGSCIEPRVRSALELLASTTSTTLDSIESARERELATLDPGTPAIAACIRDWAARAKGAAIELHLDRSPRYSTTWIGLMERELRTPAQIYSHLRIAPVDVEISTHDSKHSLSLQVADLVAGSARMITTTAVGGHPPDGRAARGLLALLRQNSLVPAFA